MEVLSLDVKREHVCQKHSEGDRDILSGVGAEIARSIERRLAALSRVLYTHLIPPSGLIQSYGSRRMALNKQFCVIECAHLQALGPLTLRDWDMVGSAFDDWSVGLRQSSLGPLQ